MPYLPDGVTEYDTQPDPLDHRRASRARFAAACLPVFISIGVLGKIVLWLAQTCADGCRFAFGSRIGGAMSVLLLAIFSCCVIKTSGWNAVATMPNAVGALPNGCSTSASGWWRLA